MLLTLPRGAASARLLQGTWAESRGAPPPPQDPSPLRGTLGSSLRSPAEGEGHEGFPPPPDKDLESPKPSNP